MRQENEPIVIVGKGHDQVGNVVVQICVRGARYHVIKMFFEAMEKEPDFGMIVMIAVSYFLSEHGYDNAMEGVDLEKLFPGVLPEEK